MAQGSVSRRMSWGAHDGGPPSFFWKCMKRKGFKYFVLKVCDSKGLADAFLRKCVKRKSLGDILASYWSCNLPRRLSGSFRWKAFSADPWPAVGGSRAKARLHSGRSEER